ncbi:MAG: ATP synthase F0 subunit B [Deltaproteobacteria bacterium]|nr:ATP synthase F0 subunit B [Candidatus Anaeroferrophillus wilburensis]MBN2889093.1 ATP synthase F0 subunit B [Deltaproteobacteria bacterium]
MKKKAVIASLVVALVSMVLVVSVCASGGGHEAEHKSLYTLLAENPMPLLKDFLWRIINFAVLLWILIKFTGKPIKNYFANRREALLQGINEAREAKDAADRMYKEYQEKLAQLDDEIKALENRIRSEAEAEKKRITAEAEQFVAKVTRQAEQMADQEVLMAKRRLKDEAARLAIEAAEAMIKHKISADDQEKMVHNYLEKVVGAQ